MDASWWSGSDYTLPESITRWMKAYSIFAAVLLSAPDMTKEEAAGLAAHAYFILQLLEDLQGSQ